MAVHGGGKMHFGGGGGKWQKSRAKPPSGGGNAPMPPSPLCCHWIWRTFDLSQTCNWMLTIACFWAVSTIIPPCSAAVTWLVLSCFIFDLACFNGDKPILSWYFCDYMLFGYIVTCLIWVAISVTVLYGCMVTYFVWVAVYYMHDCGKSNVCFILVVITKMFGIVTFPRVLMCLFVCLFFFQILK